MSIYNLDEHEPIQDQGPDEHTEQPNGNRKIARKALIAGIFTLLAIATWTYFPARNHGSGKKSAAPASNQLPPALPGTPNQAAAKTTQFSVYWIETGPYFVPWGNSRWRIARRMRGSMSIEGKITLIGHANPQLPADPNKLPAYTWITIPEVPDAPSRQQPRRHANRTSPPSSTKPSSAPSTGATTSPLPATAPTTTASSPIPEPPASANHESQPPDVSHAMASSLAPSEKDQFAFLGGLFTGYQSRTIALAEETGRRHTGYRFMLSREGAIAAKLPLRGNFTSRIFLFETEEEKARGWQTGEINHLNTRITRKGSNLVFNVQLSQLPQKPFVIVMGNTAIDGREFVEAAEPIEGRFPGPRPWMNATFRKGRALMPFVIASVLTGNPLPLVAGAMEIFIPTAAGAAMTARANHIQRRAEIRLQTVLAQNRLELQKLGLQPTAGVIPAVKPPSLIPDEGQGDTSP